LKAVLVSALTNSTVKRPFFTIVKRFVSSGV
jgi:hypothetical protein